MTDNDHDRPDVEETNDEQSGEKLSNALLTRRAVLQAGALGLASGLAGCNGNDPPGGGGSRTPVVDLPPTPEVTELEPAEAQAAITAARDTPEFEQLTSYFDSEYELTTSTDRVRAASVTRTGYEDESLNGEFTIVSFGLEPTAAGEPRTQESDIDETRAQMQFAVQDGSVTNYVAGLTEVRSGGDRIDHTDFSVDSGAVSETAAQATVTDDGLEWDIAADDEFRFCRVCSLTIKAICFHGCDVFIGIGCTLVAPVDPASAAACAIITAYVCGPFGPIDLPEDCDASSTVNCWKLGLCPPPLPEETDTEIWTSYRSGSGRRNASGGQGPTTEEVPTSQWTANGALPFGITDARQPVVVGDAVIMPFQDKLARLDPDGNEQWTTDDGPASAIVTDGETVYAIWGGALRAIDIATGEQQWRFGLAADSGLGQIHLALAGDQIVRLQEGDFNARVWAHSTSDGSELWSQELERSYSGLATSNTQIFALSRSGASFDDDPGGLITLDFDGNEQWRNEEVISPPVIVDEAGNTYADPGGTLSAGTVTTLKLGPDGSVQWQVEDGGQPWALRSGVLYTVTRDRIYARAASDGSELWNYEFEATRVVAAQDWVYAVNLGTGRVLALSGDGERQWIQEVGDGTAASLATPVPAHDQLYVPTSSGLSVFQ